MNQKMTTIRHLRSIVVALLLLAVVVGLLMVSRGSGFPPISASSQDEDALEQAMASELQLTAPSGASEVVESPARSSAIETDAKPPTHSESESHGVGAPLEWSVIEPIARRKCTIFSPEDRELCLERLTSVAALTDFPGMSSSLLTEVDRQRLAQLEAEILESSLEALGKIEDAVHRQWESGGYEKTAGEASRLPGVQRQGKSSGAYGRSLSFTGGGWSVEFDYDSSSDWEVSQCLAGISRLRNARRQFIEEVTSR